MLFKTREVQKRPNFPSRRAASVLGKNALHSLLVCAAAALSAFAAPALARSQWAVEVDPATFILDGYSLHGRYSLEDYPAWRIGIGVYSLEFPDAMIDMTSANQNEGWDLNLQQGVGLFAERYFNPDNSGWFTGLQLAGHDFALANSTLAPGEKDEYTNVLIMPYGGYLFPLASNVYVQGWAGAGYTEKVSGSNTLSGEEYKISPIFAFAAVHLGYSF